MKNEGGAGDGVECRLVVNGVTLTFTMAGPLVAMAPAAEKQPKKARRGGK